MYRKDFSNNMKYNNRSLYINSFSKTIEIISCNTKHVDSYTSLSVDSHILNNPPQNSIGSMVSLKEYELCKSFINTPSSISDYSSYAKDDSKQDERHHS